MRPQIPIQLSCKIMSRVVACAQGQASLPFFPLAVAHWTHHIGKLNPGLTICAQPRRILARDLCNRVRLNHRMHENDRAIIGYRVAKDQSLDHTIEVLYCTDAVVVLLLQSHMQGSGSARKPENITTVIIDEIHTWSVQSHFALALTLVAAVVW